MRIQAGEHRGVKAEAAGIQAVADGRIVDRVLGGCVGESGKGGRIDAGVGIDLVLSKVQGRKGGGSAARIDTILVVQDALAQAGNRYDPGDRNPSRISLAFVVIEKVQLVLYDGPTEPGAKSVSDQVGKSGTCCVVEPVICVDQAAAVKLECRAMPSVGAALGNQVDLGGG